MNKEEAKKIRKELEYRLDLCLDWYKGCDVCDETLQNATKDVNSVFDGVCKKYGLDDLPLCLRTSIEDGIIVVRVIDKKLN